MAEQTLQMSDIVLARHLDCDAFEDVQDAKHLTAVDLQISSLNCKLGSL